MDRSHLIVAHQFTTSDLQNQFPLVINSFLKKYTDVAVELFFEDAQADLSKSGFDAGIRGSEILDQDMVAVKIMGPIHYVVAGSPKYLNKVGRPKHPKRTSFIQLP